MSSHSTPFPEELSIEPMRAFRTLVIQIEDPEKITLGELQRKPSFLDLRKAKSVVFRTRPLSEQHPVYLSPHAADFLIELGIQRIGLDAPVLDLNDTIAAEALYGSVTPTRDRLQKANILFEVGLNLSEVTEGWTETNLFSEEWRLS